MKKNQSGFGALEAILFLVIFGVVGFVGWFVVQTRGNTTKSLDSTASNKVASTDSKGLYDGWKSASLQYEKVDFKYPANWTLSNNSFPAGTTEASTSTPGVDRAVVTAPNQDKLTLNTGLSKPNFSTYTETSKASIDTMADTYYLITYTDSANTANLPLVFACLSIGTPSDPAQLFSLNIFSPSHQSLLYDSPRNNFCFVPHAVKETDVKSAATALSSNPVFLTAVNILKSMKYQLSN